MTTIHKTHPCNYLRAKAEGTVEALVSVFGNVDYQGDRIMKGAFEMSLLKWAASGDPIPVIWSHDWGDPWAHIGQVTKARETDRGLEVEYRLDVADNPVAAQVHKLLAARRVKEHSFGYDVIDERTAKDEANELVELDIIEVGPTLKGANPETELLGVKSALGEMVKASDPRLFPAGTHPLRPPGPRKARTSDLARELKRRGFDPGFVDAAFGRKTDVLADRLAAVQSALRDPSLEERERLAELQRIAEFAQQRRESDSGLNYGEPW